MTVTELALLRLLPPATANDASIRTKLARAKEVMEKWTGNTFHYLQQVEDPALIYVVGEWDSAQQHVEEFIPTEDNQGLLRELEKELAVEWLIHFDAPHSVLPLPKSADDKYNRVTYSVNRHFVKDGQRGALETFFEDNKHHLQDFVTEGSIGGGYRVDCDDGKEEFVLMSPWKDVDQHYAFAKTEGFARYSKIKELIDGAEIKHAKIYQV
jgi:heme-degrading monooxygenase HmoA